jgi:phosphatidylserine/phosphatidylglycerophosphate/cardiolipin synthase-like enzyme
MHHKYVIIDGPRSLDAAGASTDKGILASGSGNWSNSAGTRYDENTVFFFGNAELNMRYQAEFNRLWGHSRDFSWNTDLEYFESDTIDESMIVDDPTVDAVFTSDNFRMWVSSRFGNTFSVVRGVETISHRIVEMIEESEESIWIASGFLRSRPVSEALLKKHEENPDMDIRVYVDGKEFIAESTHQRQLAGLEDCLNKAGDSEAKVQDCTDKGFHFSFPLQAAGIDLKFKHYSYRWHYSYAPQMHHKYLIFDGRKVMTGSYNLSDNAEHNTFENMVIFTDEAYPDMVDAYVNNFSTMWVTGDEDELFAELMDEIENGTSSRIPIVYDAMALNWEQVSQLKSALNANCADINNTSFRRTPERHYTCTRR